MLRVLLLFFFLFFLSLPGGDLMGEVESELAHETVEQFEQVRRAVSAQEAELQKLKRRQQKSESLLKKEQRLLLRHQTAEESLALELEEVAQEQQRLARSLQEVMQRSSDVRGQSLARVRATYMNPPVSLGSLLLSATESQMLSRNAFYLSRMRAHDAQILADLARLQEELSRIESEVRLLQEEKSALLEKRREEREAAAASVARQKALLAELEQQKEEKAESLFAIQVQALRMESIISALTTGWAASFSPGNVRREKTPLGRAAHELSFEGEGLREGQSLVKPVEGKLVRTFGKKRVAEFRDFLLRKGVEILVSEPSRVVTVERGVIAYAGELPALGNVVVVDHGKRSYTVYGRLKTIEASRGERVSSGETLGFLERGDSLYFELRVGGVAVSPQKFYKKGL